MDLSAFLFHFLQKNKRVFNFISINLSYDVFNNVREVFFMLSLKIAAAFPLSSGLHAAIKRPAGTDGTGPVNGSACISSGAVSRRSILSEHGGY